MLLFCNVLILSVSQSLPSPALPSGWSECLDGESGCPYYYHIQSQRSSWEHPAAAEAIKRDRDAKKFVTHTRAHTHKRDATQRIPHPPRYGAISHSDAKEKTNTNTSNLPRVGMRTGQQQQQQPTAAATAGAGGPISFKIKAAGQSPYSRPQSQSQSHSHSHSQSQSKKSTEIDPMVYSSLHNHLFIRFSVFVPCCAMLVLMMMLLLCAAVTACRTQQRTATRLRAGGRVVLWSMTARGRRPSTSPQLALSSSSARCQVRVQFSERNTETNLLQIQTN